MTVLDEDRSDLLDDDLDDAPRPWREPAADGGDDIPPPPAAEAGDGIVRRVIDVVVVVGCAAFVFWQLHPSLILADTTPAGGDMGAHVWAFAELRDNLLPSGRLSGWTPDWYAGFPVFHFYMVLPFLAMVVLNAGLSGAAAVVPLAAGGALGGYGWRRATGSRRRWLWVLAAAVVLLGVSLPYGVAFKLVTVAGVTAMPVAAYLFGRLARFPFPTPAVLALALLLFLFDRNFTIYGGNIASTLAGEFSFSIALALAITYLGVLIHGMRTGTHRATAAALLAATGLCHLLPAFFALTATVVIVVAHFAADITSSWRQRSFRAVADLRPRAWWLLSMGAVGGLVSAFWVLPFYWRRTYLNDMGWEKTAVRDPGQGVWKWFTSEVWSALVPSTPTDLRWVAALALVGAVLSVVFRNRVGRALVVLGLVLASAFVFVPQGRLWNARILPFWYLVVYLLAAIAIGEIVRAVAAVVVKSSPGTARGVLWASAPLLLLVYATYEGGQLRKFPLVYRTDDAGRYEFLGHFEVAGRNFVTDWSKWNYTGYERKERYPEYRSIVDTMAGIGRDRGCGMSLWEYNNDQNNYGTPMAMMLLPHWTDGCIGSMEGLYFEASSTTPFHFLMQSELSVSPSRAQRRMPYRDFDIDAGVAHLQLLGVRYYLAFTPEATTAARGHEDLTEIGGSAPWTVFEVADAPRVEALSFLPAVTTGGQHQEGPGAWLCNVEDPDQTCAGPALDWFQDESQWDVALAATGPDEWPRVDYGEVPERRAVEPAVVSDLDWGRTSISFEVDRPGTPVLVKASYFPNWRVSGADGPYRVAPNLMVVVPTDTEVTLTYGRTPVDVLAFLITVVGLGLLFVLSRRPAIALPRHPDDLDHTWTLDGSPAPSAHGRLGVDTGADAGPVPGPPVGGRSSVGAPVDDDEPRAGDEDRSPPT